MRWVFKQFQVWQGYIFQDDIDTGYFFYIPDVFILFLQKLIAKKGVINFTATTLIPCLATTRQARVESSPPENNASAVI